MIKYNGIQIIYFILSVIVCQYIEYKKIHGMSSINFTVCLNWGSNPGVGEIFHTCPDRSWSPPSLQYNGYRVFPGGKEQPGRDTDPSPPSSAVVKKE